MRHRELLTSGQVAALFNVSTATVGRWAREGTVPSLRMPSGRLRFDREDVEAALSVSGADAPAVVAR